MFVGQNQKHKFSSLNNLKCVQNGWNVEIHDKLIECQYFSLDEAMGGTESKTKWKEKGEKKHINWNKRQQIQFVFIR